MLSIAIHRNNIGMGQAAYGDSLLFKALEHMVIKEMGMQNFYCCWPFGDILEGKVDYAIRSFRRLIRQRNLRGKRKEEVERGIGYYQHNRHRMRYDVYLAKGYPIGSGVAEGTCRNLVKDRMECTGMRWEFVGAQSMLYLRALYLNDEWDQFVDYRIEKEQGATARPSPEIGDVSNCDLPLGLLLLYQALSVRIESIGLSLDSVVNEVFPLATQMYASQIEHRLGTGHAPTHPSTF